MTDGLTLNVTIPIADLARAAAPGVPMDANPDEVADLRRQVATLKAEMSVVRNLVTKMRVQPQRPKTRVQVAVPCIPVADGGNVVRLGRTPLRLVPTQN